MAETIRAAVVRRLARDEDIMVAGPMLAQSPRLVTADLVEIASAMSAEHLYAISSRAAIDEPVTDILVRRGDFTVKRKLADPNRLGLGGWSYGGFLTAWGVTQTKNKFKAGVMAAGISDKGQLVAESDLPDILVCLSFVGVSRR